MIFEYDPQKSLANAQKNGIDFEQAKALWKDAHLVRLRALQPLDEARWLVIGKIGEKHYTAIITHLGKVVRIISVRRAGKKEVTLYESQKA
jgi:uncharacterized DUF497 family protein